MLEIKEMNPILRGATTACMRAGKPAGTTIPRRHTAAAAAAFYFAKPRMAPLTHIYPRDLMIGILRYIKQSLATPPHDFV